MDYLSVLKEYFGYDSFRGIQKDIVESIGAGRDTLGLMPTGGGKSITFQVPALAMDGVCIVVTPLIALMKDQVEHLRERGITASYVNSSMTFNEIQQVYDNAVFGGLKFLYISPERIASSLFIAKLRYMNVCFITVDEAHCISQWGYDFRPSYLHISDIRELKPEAPILALTATATAEVVEDIQRQLAFRESNVIKMSFRRANLIYVTRKVTDPYSELIHILNSTTGSCIVYLRSRKGVKELSDRLCDDGISATFYHAGLDFAVKDRRQEQWQNDEFRVMVATNAFGMGIDKPDVRLVVHIDCPDSIEAYFQEAGRAGRDGRKSYAVLLYGAKTRSRVLERLEKAFPPKDYIRKVYDHLAYFFQLAVESGEGAVYDFDVNRFCVTFRHFPSTLHSALTILQRAGYIYVDLDPDTHARVQILLTRNQLYGIQGLSRLEDSVLETLLRIYNGIFANLIYIEEAEIADFAGLESTHLVRVALKELAHKRVIKYVPRKEVPQITYIKQRVDSERLVIGPDVYEDMRERMEKRLMAMVDYAFSVPTGKTRCHSVALLHYFGEESEPCGMCDACLGEKRQERELQKNFPDASVTEQALRETVIDHIRQVEQQDKGRGVLVSTLLKTYHGQDITGVLRRLYEENIIAWDGVRVSLILS